VFLLHLWGVGFHKFSCVSVLAGGAGPRGGAGGGGRDVTG
jgi:hypothetical protein